MVIDRFKIVGLPESVALHRVLRTRDAAEFCGLSVSHFRRLHSRGEIPRAVRLSERRLGWRIGDLVAWISSREG